MKNETKFWNDIASSANPGWVIRVDPRIGSGTTSLAGNDTFIYIVDVASGWVGGGAIRSSDVPEINTWSQTVLAAAKNIAPLVATSTADLAGNAIAECGEAWAEAKSTAVTVAISMTVSALLETQTFALAAPANRQRCEADMAGHWIYLAYRTKAGKGIITRPIWVSTVHPGIGRAGRFLDTADLLGIIRKVVQSETTTTQSIVGKGLAAEGGAIVSPNLLDAA